MSATWIGIRIQENLLILSNYQRPTTHYYMVASLPVYPRVAFCDWLDRRPLVQQLLWFLPDTVCKLLQVQNDEQFVMVTYVMVKMNKLILIGE